MISLVIAVLLLIIHALVCLVLWTLMKLGLLPVRGHMLAVMVLVPLWGPLLVLLLCARSRAFGDACHAGTLESLRLKDDMRRGVLVQGRETDAVVVPLEEALIVNDAGDRRRLMLSMLTEDPSAYLAQLQAAKLNDDVEVISDGWLEQLVAPLDEPDVGLTGCRLYFSDETVQHAGHAYARGHYLRAHRR